MSVVNKLASGIFNTIQGGLAGYNATLNISIEQLEQEVCETRLFIMKKYAMQNQLPLKDLYRSITCIEVDCASLDKCLCSEDVSKPVAHFEIPQIFLDAKEGAIQFLGSTDKQVKFKVYTDPTIFKYHKYKTRGSKRPYVYIDITPNQNNMLDCYIFNAPLLERVTIIAIFKDIRDLDQFSCCNTDQESIDNITWIDTEVRDLLTKQYVNYYRQLIQPPHQNDQVPR